MNIYILRHASAGVRRVNPILDHKRPLDKDGKRHCLQLAHVLNAMNLQFDLIVSSPLKRCMQTASLVGTEMGYEAKILSSAALAPDATFAQFQKLLQEYAECREPACSWAITPTSPASSDRCSTARCPAIRLTDHDNGVARCASAKAPSRA